MKTFFQNTFIQSMLVFFAIIGVVAVYQTVTYYRSAALPDMDAVMEDAMDAEMDTVNNTVEIGEEVAPDAMMGMPAIDMDGMEEMVVESTDETDVYAGTHIMPNGMVMTGSGEMMHDAVILENGDIEMPDGTIVTPVGDFRN